MSNNTNTAPKPAADTEPTVGVTPQAIKNVFSARWWGAIARTTIATGPTPAAAGGVVGFSVGAGAAAASITKNCL